MIDTGTNVAHGTAQATIRSVVQTGMGTYRRSFWRIVIAAVLVFAPIDIVVTIGTTLAVNFAQRSDVLGVFLWTSGTALSVAGTTLSLVFFSGVVDRIVAEDQKGEEGIPIREILSRLPVLRLVLASLLAAVFTVIGLILFLVPGFVCMILFAGDGTRRWPRRTTPNRTLRRPRPRAREAPQAEAEAQLADK